MIAALALAAAVAGGEGAGAAPPPPDPVARAVFEETLQIDPEEAEGFRRSGPKAASSRSAGRVEVFLSPRAFAVVSKEGGSLYDFDSLRIARWTGDGKKSSSASFESVVDGRVMEFENRLRIAGMITELGKAMPGFDALDLETLFSLEKEPGKPAKEIASRESEGGRLFESGGQPQARFSLERRPLAAELQPSWVRYLRHQTSIHPSVLRSVEKDPGVPTQFECRWRNAGMKHVRAMKLILLEDGKGKFPVPPAGTSVAEGPLERALAAAAGVKAPTRESAVAGAKDLEKAGKPVDAFLGLMAHGLATGDAMTPEIKALMADPKAMAEVREILSRLRASNLEEAIEQSEWLQARKGQGYRNGFVLDIFSSGLLSPGGEPEVRRARDLLLGVVTAHPEVAGAWHDLGQILRGMFQADDAWSCWEVALRLAPDHGIHQDVRDLRTSLRAEHPEFFR